MLGTDYPFPLGEQEPGKLIESMAEFDEETKVRALAPASPSWAEHTLDFPKTMTPLSEIARLLKANAIIS
jgi:hypothetical protein